MNIVASIDGVWQAVTKNFSNLEEKQILPLLKQYGVMPQFAREMIIAEAIATINLTPEERFQLYKNFYQEQKINTDADVQTWLKVRGLETSQLDYLVTRLGKLEKFQQETWGNKLHSYFLQRKGKLDRVVYSLLRVDDMAIAQELYFRIQAGEQSFGELAKEYSQGLEAHTYGLLGPVELSVPHPTLANLLMRSQPGQLLAPTSLEKWIVIVRLEKIIPAQFDTAMQKRLLNELMENWLQTQLKEFITQV
ncbi:peptidylprolyl isomerase [Calothrix sp. 336/3]|uniref:peptidylprolyl isomerase n=1 Tax=Calothrix sp. 336/3 TaxID=1337936 RepID=UPI0004E3B783|nr:peptidylprolyl isomerase [Calothrix sp. 336/3]AKG20154.1 peptidylprolyl isomerase [Calothrix sp. 336/3]